MKAAELRQSILQAAVQGKLVPQNVHDEPGSELLKRIQQEKVRLIKEGKIKKDKPLPPIAEDEVPYDLPDGWVWCRLGEAITLVSGQHIESAYYNNQRDGTPYLTGPTDFGDLTTIITKWTKTPKVIVRTGCLLITVKGSGVGSLNYLSETAAIGRQLMAIDSIVCGLEYVFCFMSHSKIYYSNKKMGIAIPGISREDILYTVFPLPPLSEQKRIVTKVDELMALCDELEAAEIELGILEKRFEDYLPKSILQAAVQGKLVPQNVHDEPAFELLKRIQQEKARLVKEGKIKKEKPLPPIAEDEVPYDLPDGWVWCSLGDVVIQDLGGGTPSKQNSDYWDGDIPWASVKDLKGDYIDQTLDKITKLGLEDSSSNLIPAGNVIVCTRMGLGKISLNKVPIAINQDLRALFLPQDKLNLQYFINYYKAQIIIGDGTTVKGISIGELHSMLLPLPPLAEQHRIVAKVDELMALCDELKTAKVFAVKSADSNVLPFPQQGEDEELLMVAQGEVSGKLSKELKQAQEDLFEDGADE